MPEGKPAGVVCIHLSEEQRCMIYDHPDRPRVCSEFKADPDVCGNNREEAMALLQALEGGSGS
jgi:Fe-S-cluster containining protein